ncbi:WxL domain-containing protein [Enterococcus faecium]|nr:WxL domain-containing protein [Enterococcus faecium]
MKTIVSSQCASILIDVTNFALYRHKRKIKVVFSCHYQTVIKIKPKGSDLDMKKHVALFSSVLMMSTTLLGAGSVFAANNDSMSKSADTPLSVTLQEPDNGGTNPVPPTEPDGGEGDNNHNPSLNTKMGFAYYPKQFNFPQLKLADKGEQSVTATKNHSFNLGVKDKTRGTLGWTVKGRLVWDSGKEITGASIKTSNAEGTVKINENDSTGNFDESLMKPVGDKVIGEKNVNITTSDTLIMTGQSDKIHNSVYDYDLGDVTLNIPEVKEVAAGQKTGNVHWTLDKVPSGEQSL